MSSIIDEILINYRKDVKFGIIYNIVNGSGQIMADATAAADKEGLAYLWNVVVVIFAAGGMWWSNNRNTKDIAKIEEKHDREISDLYKHIGGTNQGVQTSIDNVNKTMTEIKEQIALRPTAQSIKEDYIPRESHDIHINHLNSSIGDVKQNMMRLTASIATMSDKLTSLPDIIRSEINRHQK